MFDSGLLRLGIDDLAKFRIVQFACSRPGFRGAAEEFAEELGFRSIDRTAAILAELAERRLLDRSAEGAGPRYCLTRQADRRRALAEVGLTGPVTAEDAELIARLARLSLSQVRGRQAACPNAGRAATTREVRAHGSGL